MQIVIQKNIPIPATHIGFSNAADTFKKMKVGDSFSAPYVDRAECNRVFARYYQQAKKYGWTLTSRRLLEDGKKVIRIWRIK